LYDENDYWFSILESNRNKSINKNGLVRCLIIKERPGIEGRDCLAGNAIFVADNDPDYPVVHDISLEDEDDYAEVARIIEHTTCIKAYLKQRQDKVCRRCPRKKKDVAVTGDDANSTLTPSTNHCGCCPRSSSSTIISTKEKSLGKQVYKIQKINLAIHYFNNNVKYIYHMTIRF
jgi:hypothetical protein